MFTDLYVKDLSIWFDGYRNEEVVLLDEVDPTFIKSIKQLLKKWADSYPCSV